MNKKYTYEEIKMNFFDKNFDYCKTKFRGNQVEKWKRYENGIRFAFDQLEESFDSPVENLMVYVIYIILNAGRHFNSHYYAFKCVEKMLLEYDIEDITENLEEEERKEFLYDLNLVLENREVEE